jgi:hypothetical protein
MSRSPDFKINKSIPELISDTRRPEILPDTGWYRVSITENFEASGPSAQFIGSTLAVFKNSWNNVVGSDVPPASWYLSGGGEVRYRGRVTGGAIGTLIFVVPEEVRPEFTEYKVCQVIGGGTASVSIWPDGSVIFEGIN